MRDVPCWTTYLAHLSKESFSLVPGSRSKRKIPEMWLVTLFFLFTSAAQALEKNALSARDPAIDPLDFSWITSWAAVGDSFTAGIGSGNVYSSQKEDRACSRYDYSYPSILNQYFGSSVNNFTYLACSGDTSVDIAAQIARLSEGLDLAVMTAGGNDLCLVSLGSIIAERHRMLIRTH